MLSFRCVRAFVSQLLRRTISKLIRKSILTLRGSLCSLQRTWSKGLEPPKLLLSTALCQSCNGGRQLFFVCVHCVVFRGLAFSCSARIHAGFCATLPPALLVLLSDPIATASSILSPNSGRMVDATGRSSRVPPAVLLEFCWVQVLGTRNMLNEEISTTRACLRTCACAYACVYVCVHFRNK